MSVESAVLESPGSYAASSSVSDDFVQRVRVLPRSRRVEIEPPVDKTAIRSAIVDDFERRTRTILSDVCESGRRSMYEIEGISIVGKNAVLSVREGTSFHPNYFIIGYKISQDGSISFNKAYSLRNSLSGNAVFGRLYEWLNERARAVEEGRIEEFLAARV